LYTVHLAMSGIQTHNLVINMGTNLFKNIKDFYGIC
jgi:hypothetical protein